MNKTIKRFLATTLAATMVMGTSMTSFAAGWQQNSTGWWYGTNADNSTWYSNGWQWIDGKCYYFDGNGYMLTNTTTPDGYQVDASGAWVVNGVVQTQATNTVTNTTTNTEYPLAGMLEQLGLNDTGVEGWTVPDHNMENNMKNGPYLPATGKYKYTNYGYAGLYSFACALSGEPYHDYLFDRTDPIEVIANFNGVSYADAQQMVGIVRDFLNSFDWKNADDMTKASKAAELVTNGKSYSYQPAPGYVSAILLDNAGACNDFAATYHLLTRLMGMDSLHVKLFGHEINYIKINGTWYEFDGSEHAMYHTSYVFESINSGNFGSLIYPDAEARAELGIQ